MVKVFMDAEFKKKLIQIGDSIGIIIPADLLHKLGIGKGDNLIYKITGYEEKE